MSESVNIENENQNHHKLPLSIARITCEILAGYALGSISLLLVFFTGFWITGSNELGDFVFLILFLASSPLLYGIGCASGIYLIGSIGRQTGSFSISLVAGFVAGLVALFLTFCVFRTLTVMQNLVPLLLFIIPPIPATICFNLTRRYKKPKWN